MKINNYDVDMYLEGIEDTDEIEIVKEGLPLSKRPSVEKRHIRSQRKVKETLEEISDNTTWNLYLEIKNRWSDCMDLPMTHYRGNVKTGAQIFEEVDRMAMAFDEMGLEYGDQIVACMSNVPEVLTLLLAASKCGLIVNFMSDKFDKTYIRKIFKQTPGKKLFIGTDDKYGRIADLVDEACFADKVIVSLTDSLKDGIDPYSKYDSIFCKFVNRVPEFKKKDRFIMSYSDLLDISKKWDSFDNGYAKRDFYPAKDALNAPLTITYNMDGEVPKQIVHANRSYIYMARFYDTDLSRIPFVEDSVSLAHIPTYSNTNLSTCIINAVAQKGAVAFEPIYHPKFLLCSMVINQPTHVFANRSFLVETAKQMKKNPDSAEEGFANAIVVAAVDELPSKSEERFINNALKEADAGGEVLPIVVGTNSVLPVLAGPTVLSVAGGTLEQGNLFFTLFKERQEKVSTNKASREDCGLVPLQLANIAIIDEAGRECGFEEYGRLVLNSNCTMMGYLTEHDNKLFRLMDNDGRVWTDTNCWGAILKNGNVIMKGKWDAVTELGNGQKVPHFMIADKLMEQENVLSCEVVKPEGHEDALVAHIEFNPEEADVCPEWLEMLLGDVEKKCQDSFSEELADKIVYKVRPFNHPYPLTTDGKRSIAALEAEGIDDCYKPDITGCEVEMIPAGAHFTKVEEKPMEKVKTS